ncbi:hypothetical protein LTR47_000019 [Exophiala xenobiotica]|nr:hypothetical protein LTR47_000019 [Exophiala xenobiotica]KAK5242434.1 hypothetical protein LTS06_011525 [Exophiala xenobiotica]KAK5259843.1 hypothetical protein LTR40_005226 [Exophiala xenobiotica]KAK5349996.1 hypothetical protein LTR61_006702 [Exophiala xenobiotica]KAK5387084.1 hypothetical protein LTR11_000749 [Exophiala xenobiotica]
MAAPDDYKVHLAEHVARGDMVDAKAQDFLTNLRQQGRPVTGIARVQDRMETKAIGRAQQADLESDTQITQGQDDVEAAVDRELAHSKLQKAISLLHLEEADPTALGKVEMISDMIQRQSDSVKLQLEAVVMAEGDQAKAVRDRKMKILQEELQALRRSGSDTHETLRNLRHDSSSQIETLKKKLFRCEGKLSEVRQLSTKLQLEKDMLSRSRYETPERQIIPSASTVAPIEAPTVTLTKEEHDQAVQKIQATMLKEREELEQKLEQTLDDERSGMKAEIERERKQAAEERKAAGLERLEWLRKNEEKDDEVDKFRREMLESKIAATQLSVNMHELRKLLDAERGRVADVEARLKQVQEQPNVVAYILPLISATIDKSRQSLLNTTKVQNAASTWLKEVSDSTQSPRLLDVTPFACCLFTSALVKPESLGLAAITAFGQLVVKARNTNPEVLPFLQAIVQTYAHRTTSSLSEEQSTFVLRTIEFLCMTLPRQDCGDILQPAFNALLPHLSQNTVINRALISRIQDGLPRAFFAWAISLRNAAMNVTEDLPHWDFTPHTRAVINGSVDELLVIEADPAVADVADIEILHVNAIRYRISEPGALLHLFIRGYPTPGNELEQVLPASEAMDRMCDVFPGIQYED